MKPCHITDLTNSRSPTFFFFFSINRLWSKVTAGLAGKDMDAATDEKSFIENKQREETAARQKEGLQWHPRFFNVNKHEEYEFKGVNG